MKVLKAYKYRLYPTPSQIEFIEKTFSNVRLVHNLLLQDRIQLYKKIKENPKEKIKMPTPAKYKKQYPQLKEVDSLALANAQVHLDQAFKNYFHNKNTGFPKPKLKKNAVTSYTTNNQKGTVRIVKLNYLKIPKLKTLLKFKMHRPISGKIKSATISRTTSGKYFVSLLCEEWVVCQKKTDLAVGITLGTSYFAILSNGQRIDNDKLTEEIEQKIRREERKLARKKKLALSKGLELSCCKNYQKQKIVVAKLRERLLNQRVDFLNKLTTQLVQKYDFICIEDIHKEDFYRNSKLNRGIADVSWALFVSKLEYKALWHQKKIIKVVRCNTRYQDELGSNHLKKDIDSKKGKQDPETEASIQLLYQGLSQVG